MTRSNSQPFYPIGIGGLGGSGTRCIADIVSELGFYMGGDLNESRDNLWYSFLFKRPDLLSGTADQVEALADIFVSAMSGPGNYDQNTLTLIQSIASEESSEFDADWKSQRAESLCDALFLEDNDKAWAWKEPNTHVFVDQMASCIHDLRYVHVIRNGLDMAFSPNKNQLRYWSGPLFRMYDFNAKNPSIALRYWRLVNERVARIKEQGVLPVLEVGFETLCARPVEQILSIAEFCNRPVSRSEAIRIAGQVVRPPSTIGRHRDKDLSVFDPVDIDYVNETEKRLGISAAIPRPSPKKSPARAARAPKENFLFLTYDSCRYDVLCDARTPVLDSYCEIERAQTPACFTYAAHHAFFVGIIPCAVDNIPYYNRFAKQLLALMDVGEANVIKDARYGVHSEVNLIAGIRDAGYQTVGAGAMNWFKQASLTLGFDKFKFTGRDANGQIDYLLQEIRTSDPFFGFINFGETHAPYVYTGKKAACPITVRARNIEWPPVETGPVGRDCVAYGHQVEAAEFLDGQIGRLFANLPQNTTVVLCADHGECFGEDGYWGHGVNHPKVWEVPLAIFRLDRREVGVE